MIKFRGNHHVHQLHGSQDCSMGRPPTNLADSTTVFIALAPIAWMDFLVGMVVTQCQYPLPKEEETQRPRS
jgi:hypothetical protein